jgi:hypothetical protein
MRDRLQRGRVRAAFDDAPGHCDWRPLLCPLILAILIPTAPIAVLTQTPATELHIALKHGSEAEQATADQLRRLVKERDVQRWILTRDIIVEEKAIPNSHPVLTVNVQYRENDDALLATFLHEQFHWLEEGNAEFKAAMQAFAEIYPKAPAGPPEGARDLESTYRHLVVCDLEYQAMTILVGEAKARQILAANRHYIWIYDRVLNDPRVRQINLRHGMVAR